MCKVCWKINDFMKWFRSKTFCYFDVSLEEIREEVDRINEQSDNFEVIKEVAPDIQNALTELRYCKQYSENLESYIDDVKTYITELYVADMEGDVQRRREIYDYLIENKFIK